MAEGADTLTINCKFNNNMCKIKAHVCFLESKNQICSLCVFVNIKNPLHWAIF